MTDVGNVLRDPLALMGVGLVLVAGVSWFFVEVSLAAFLAQSSLPVVVGVGLLVYAWYSRDRIADGFRSTVLVWIGLGVLGFFAVGFWFGAVSRRFETSFFLAVFASLSTGAAFGALVGTYAARLRRVNAELTTQRDRLERFASILSHDLRGPLSVARGRLELLADEHGSEHVDPIERSLDRMDVLIDDVLALVRHGREVTERERVDVAVLAERCRDAVGGTDVRLETESAIEVRADPVRLRQLLENLVRNSVEHGGESVTITVGALDSEPGFYVADDGPGIPPEAREQVFDEGYSTADDGTGLGLAIVRAVVEAHGWDIRATESDQGGARFEVTGVEPDA
jgi:signal transduction histidine kinase